jgi:hypothetical protein
VPVGHAITSLNHCALVKRQSPQCFQAHEQDIFASDQQKYFLYLDDMQYFCLFVWIQVCTNNRTPSGFQ